MSGSTAAAATASRDWSSPGDEPQMDGRPTSQSSKVHQFWSPGRNRPLCTPYETTARLRSAQRHNPLGRISLDVPCWRRRGLQAPSPWEERPLGEAHRSRSRREDHSRSSDTASRPLRQYEDHSHRMSPVRSSIVPTAGPLPPGRARSTSRTILRLPARLCTSHRASVPPRGRADRETPTSA
jgi:hypothetical protein